MKTLQMFVCVAVFSIFCYVGPAIAGDEKKAVVVAKVDSKEILLEDVNIFVRPVLERAKAMGQQVTPELEETIRKQWIDHLISRTLLLNYAKSKNVAVSEEDIKKSMSHPQYSGVNLPPEKLKELVKGDLMINNVIESNIMSKVAISPKDIQDFYNERKAEMVEPEQVKARHILFKVGAEDPKEKKDVQLNKAKNILKEAKNGKTDFGELAKKHSEGPSAPNGGDLGFFARGRMVPAFENAAFALKPNEVSDVVETQFGYHIIKVEEKKESRTIPFDEIKEAIKENIKVQRGNKEIEKWIDELRGKAKIELM